MKKLFKFLKDEEGIEIVEWGLMAALFAIAVGVAMTAMAAGASEFFTDIGTYLGGVVVPPV